VAIKEDRPLIEVLVGHGEISKHVTRAQLEAMCEPSNHLGQAGVMVDRVLAHRR
jgi:3-carboxy-cis,cis-muconate cycloisomerase